jgi:hypothetical protein
MVLELALDGWEVSAPRVTGGTPVLLSHMRKVEATSYRFRFKLKTQEATPNSAEAFHFQRISEECKVR